MESASAPPQQLPLRTTSPSPRPSDFATSAKLSAACALLERLSPAAGEDAELAAAIEVIRRRSEALALATGTPRVEPLAPDTFAFTSAEAAVVLGLAEELAQAAPRGAAGQEAFCRAANRLARRLPERLLETLADFAFRGSRSGTLLLEGLPWDPAALPPTPSDNKQHLGEGTALARVAALVNHANGQQMVAYEAEGFGRLFQDMVPNRALAQTQTSLGSGVELELHTEQAFSKIRPDVLTLACLRGDADAKTFALSARVLLEHLSDDERALLRLPLWITGVDMSFKMGGHAFLEGDVRGPMPILGGAEDDPLIVFDQDLMSGTTDEAQAAIARVIEVYKQQRATRVLAPGHILLIDNVRAVHGRSRFTPRWDGTDRWLARSFAVRDLVRTRYARPAAASRTMAAQFS